MKASYQFYLAVTSGTTTHFSPQVTLRVESVNQSLEDITTITNMPPFFAEEPDLIYFDLKSNKSEIKLPEILDSYENFCRIEIDSDTLGSTFFTNASDEAPTNEYLSYHQESNTISITQPSERIEEFRGEHILTVVLIDTLDAEKSYFISVTFYEIEAI